MDIREDSLWFSSIVREISSALCSRGVWQTDRRHLDWQPLMVHTMAVDDPHAMFAWICYLMDACHFSAGCKFMYSVPLQCSNFLLFSSTCTSVLPLSTCDLLHHWLNTIKSRLRASSSGLVYQINPPNPCVSPSTSQMDFCSKLPLATTCHCPARLQI